jgi:hypothetical protein
MVLGEVLSDEGRNLIVVEETILEIGVQQANIRNGRPA